MDRSSKVSKVGYDKPDGSWESVQVASKETGRKIALSREGSLKLLLTRGDPWKILTRSVHIRFYKSKYIYIWLLYNHIKTPACGIQSHQARYPEGKPYILRFPRQLTRGCWVCIVGRYLYSYIYIICWWFYLCFSTWIVVKHNHDTMYIYNYIWLYYYYYYCYYYMLLLLYVIIIVIIIILLVLVIITIIIIIGIMIIIIMIIIIIIIIIVLIPLRWLLIHCYWICGWLHSISCGGGW